VIGGGIGAPREATVWRHLADGTLDPCFGNAGVATLPHVGDAGDNSGERILVDGQGRVILVGTSLSGGNSRLTLWRLLDDGTLDPAWGTAGVTVAGDAVAGGDDYPTAATFDGQGRVVVTGVGDNGTDKDLVVWRFDSSGALDTSFATGGTYLFTGTGGYMGDDDPHGIAIDSSGRIYVSARTEAPSGGDAMLLRLDANGGLDTGFNTTGVVVEETLLTTLAAGTDLGVVVDASDRPIMAAWGQASAQQDVAVVRYTTAGALDTTFGTNGGTLVGTVIGTMAAPNGLQPGGRIILDAQGNILVGVTDTDGTTASVRALRYGGNGTLDTAFGTSGVLTVVGPSGINTADVRGDAIAEDASGRLVFTGRAGDNPRSPAIWAYR
jgi:uncharacterized delta-60 repeat protein